jgi:hypothetical protein
MWGRYPHHRYLPTYWWPRRDHDDVIWTTRYFLIDVITTTDRLQPLYHRTTSLPDLHRQLQGKRTQLASTASPDITTSTGRTFITDQSSKRRFLIDRVRASACSLASSSHNSGRAFTTTTAWLMALSSSLTADCLLASTWDYAGTTRHPTPLRRTSTTSFQHLWRKHRSTTRETSPRRHYLNTPWHACRTTSTVRCSFFTPPSVPPSSSSLSTRPRVPVATYASPHASTRKQPSLLESDVGSSHTVMWQPRTRRWSRHTDNAAGSSDVKPKNEATR